MDLISRGADRTGDLVPNQLFVCDESSEQFELLGRLANKHFDPGDGFTSRLSSEFDKQRLLGVVDDVENVRAPAKPGAFEGCIVQIRMHAD